VREREYCANHVELDGAPTIHECASLVADDERCGGGNGMFVHSESAEHCSCCTDGDALENTQVPLMQDLHMYYTQNNTAVSKWCDSAAYEGRRCGRCESNGQFCAECQSGYSLLLGGCFNLNY